jgi:hypothetical protein
MILPTIDERAGMVVDFVLSVPDYERQAIGRSRLVGFGGVGVRLAAAEDVVVHKLVAGRPRDIEDTHGIVAKNPGLGTGYVERWLAVFGRTLDRDIGHTFRWLLES